MMRAAALMISLLLTACTAANSEGPTPLPATAEGPCRNEGLDPFIGQTASAALGTQLLEASGARILRWAAPGMILTTEFRRDRLNVDYDEKMVITSARCG